MNEQIRTHDKLVTERCAAFMRQGWRRPADSAPDRHPVALWAEARRDRLAGQFPGEKLVIPAGPAKVRAHDTDYRFRPDTAHTYLCGNQTSDAVLVIDDGEPTLFVRSAAERGSDESFFRDARNGELWVGPRSSLAQMSYALGLPCRTLNELDDVLAGGKMRVHRGVDRRVDSAVTPHLDRDNELARCLSELRLQKDPWEIEQIQEAVDATILGFEDSVCEWNRVLQYGERWIEGTFARRARTLGNGMGYEPIVGSGAHATVLHWTANKGPVTPGQLLLLDMGVEGGNLYTADISRTLPISGSFTNLQRDLYELVLNAQKAGIDAIRPGAQFGATDEAAMTVLAHGLDDLGLLPVSVDEALSPESKVYSRWTLHRTSHMLGMDVHDCGQASRESYSGGVLMEDMVLTVEPGLYFQDDDLLVPQELRGIGIRIEDDILVTSNGSRNLSAALPREFREVERWMASLAP